MENHINKAKRAREAWAALPGEGQRGKLSVGFIQQGISYDERRLNTACAIVDARIARHRGLERRHEENEGNDCEIDGSGSQEDPQEAGRIGTWLSLPLVPQAPFAS